jgi:DNA-binding MarR family transcriptional regulator
VSARLTDSELRDWYAFIRAHHVVIGRLGADLEQEHGMSLPYYEVLLRLSRAPDQRMRMTDLARAVFLSPSGLTRLVDRLVRDGLVERQPCPGDARAINAAMTAAGNEAFQAAARTHVRGIRELFLERLPTGDRTALRKSLEALTRRE